MSTKSNIEWTEMTWNPTTGCTKISAGCKNCYAETWSTLLQKRGFKEYQNGFRLTIHQHRLYDPLKWKSPRIVFVNSMSDLFHPEVPLEFIQKVFEVMNNTPQHTYQVLTKRAERLFELHIKLNWTDNIWMGVSVENEKVKSRIDLLRNTNAKTKFLSCEPLIGPLQNMNLQNINWVIVGGESGRKSRPMEELWVWDIKDQCREQEVAFFFKQWGGVNKKKAGRELAGMTYDEMPYKFSAAD